MTIVVNCQGTYYTDVMRKCEEYAFTYLKREATHYTFTQIRNKDNSNILGFSGEMDQCVKDSCC